MITLPLCIQVDSYVLGPDNQGIPSLSHSTREMAMAMNEANESQFWNIH